jgi:hypothetical protein
MYPLLVGCRKGLVCTSLPLCCTRGRGNEGEWGERNIAETRGDKRRRRGREERRAEKRGKGGRRRRGEGAGRQREDFHSLSIRYHF